MGHYFQPSPQRATDLACTMASSLRESLSVQLQTVGASIPSTQHFTSGAYRNQRPRPSDFTAYFDLVALEGHSVEKGGLHADKAVRRAELVYTRLTSDCPHPHDDANQPRVVTLCPQHFSEDELSALLRWWDTEPQNALGLVPLEPDELKLARLHIAKALEELAQSAPQLHGEVMVLIKDIVVARPGDARRMDFGGVSSFAAWGAIGLNQEAHVHWVQFMKTIVHESAHLLLFAVAREEPLVLNDPAERYGSPLRQDLRPLDGIFHAAFVSAREAFALDACLRCHEGRAKDADSEVSDMLEQSLEDSVLAFWDCCDQLQSHARLSALGTAILQDCQNYMQEAFEVQAGV